jgi:hypothetical protein
VRPLRQGADGQPGAPKGDDTPIRDIIAKIRHTTAAAGWRGRRSFVSGIEGVSSRPVRKIVLQGG